MHVLIGVGRCDAAVGDPRVEPVEGVQHPLQFVVVQVAGRRERVGVSARSGDVVLGETPVEVG